MKKQRHYYELDYKRRTFQEYLAGVVPAQELVRRASLERVLSINSLHDVCSQFRSQIEILTLKRQLTIF